MKEEIINYLKINAEKNEKKEFCIDDPVKFAYWYPISKKVDVECAAFIAAMLSFGSRKQFIPKILLILELADQMSGSISNWIKQDTPGFPETQDKFYRFYSYSDLKQLFSELKSIIISKDNGDSLLQLGDFYQNLYRKNPEKDLGEIIVSTFKKSKIVPKGKYSAKKRIYMFLRWMVRINSPVDLGLWTWYPASRLIIPLDVHVLKESERLGLIKKGQKPSLKTAIELTNQLKKVYPNDPCRCDFSLFGAGVKN